MRIAFHTLGCKVNQYETEAMKEQFSAAGHQIAGEEDFADAYVINTCTVTNLADRKSRQYIRRMKKVNPDAVIAVTGCYAQVNPEEVSQIEGVNVVAGTNEKQNLLAYIEDYLREENGAEQGGTSEGRAGQGNTAGHGAGQDDAAKGGMQGGTERDGTAMETAAKGHTAGSGVQTHVLPYDELTEYCSTGIITSMESRTRAYIKIQEGCNRFCSYCIIPFARGRVRSRPLAEIMEEARGLVAAGFKEIILTGINTALYGEDLGYGGIAPLIAQLNAMEGDFRIRLSSLEPTVVNADYVKGLLQYEKLCPHLHLSIQSGSDNILAAMNRRYDRAEYLDIVKALQDFDPLYGITTDIIAGFPGESEEDFADSLRMIDEAGFCKVHAFRYSPRKGTRAAEMKNQVDGNVKNERGKRLADKADAAASLFYDKCRGARRRVLFEEQTEDGLLTGYADNYVKVYAAGSQALLNQFSMVKLLEEYQDGMKGEIENG